MWTTSFQGRALLVGCPGELLDCVEHDVDCMATMLRKRGFAIEVRTGSRATRAEILAGYDELIAGAQPDDARVFYYSGHGFRAFVEKEARPWQGISTADLGASTDTDFRGITSWELSIKQAQLTERTKNVTVILDCCHAAQMSRGAAAHGAVPKVLPHPFRRGFGAHLRGLRARYGDVFDTIGPLGSADAVRLVACGQTECAFPYRDRDGRQRSAFTAALVEVLEEVGDEPMSWAAIGDAIRERVLRKFPTQHPQIEGPARRRPFSLELAPERTDGSVTISVTPDGFQLGAGRLMGITPGDVYGVMPRSSGAYRAEKAIAEVQVGEASATSATAKLLHWKNGHSALPRGAIAVPAEKAAVRRAVAIDVPPAARKKVEAELAATRILRPAEPGEGAVLATLRLQGSALTIEDGVGPLFEATRFPEALRDTVKDLANLGAAQGLRELEGAHGVAAEEVEIEWGVVERGQPRRLPDRGSWLGLHDRVHVTIRSKAHRPLYAHVFNIGIDGRIKRLTDFAPSGFELIAQESEFVLGQQDDGAFPGIELYWPDGVPRETTPRLDEFVVIVTATAVNLQGLETAARLAGVRGAGSKLQHLLAQLQDGLPRDTRTETPIDGFIMKRLWYLLHPREAAMADVPFAIDDNPLRQVVAGSPDAWLAPHWQHARENSAVRPRGPTVGAIEIRLDEIVIRDSRALSPDVRIDALVCTRTNDKGSGYAAWTQKCFGVEEGKRLDLDRPIVFRGLVYDFVEIHLWLSRETRHGLSLATLLARRAGSPEFEDAALALSTGARVAPWITATGGSAVLARIAYNLLEGVGGAIGIFRTAFTAREQFGIGRHPVEGSHHTGESSFRLGIKSVWEDQVSGSASYARFARHGRLDGEILRAHEAPDRDAREAVRKLIKQDWQDPSPVLRVVDSLASPRQISLPEIRHMAQTADLRDALKIAEYLASERAALFVAQFMLRRDDGLPEPLSDAAVYEALKTGTLLDPQTRVPIEDWPSRVMLSYLAPRAGDRSEN